MSTFNYFENENWMPKPKTNTMFIERFAIETSVNTKLWSLIPQINWNRSYYEIELRWLCASLRFRNNDKFYYQQTKDIGKLKSDVYKIYE